MCWVLRFVGVWGRFLSVSFFLLFRFLFLLLFFEALFLFVSPNPPLLFPPIDPPNQLTHLHLVHTLSTFSSVLLVTVTVTRKMFTMILSVVAFGHRLSEMQWLGVGLVFGGIGVEAGIARREKIAKEEAKRKAKAALGKAQ